MTVLAESENFASPGCLGVALVEVAALAEADKDPASRQQRWHLSPLSAS